VRIAAHRELGDVLLNAERLYGDGLVWLEQQSDRPWTAVEKTRLLAIAGRRNNIATMNWLRERGAAWPNSFVSACRVNGDPYRMAWTIPAMKYALANGHTWADGNWQCQQFAPELYSSAASRKNAMDLSAWAHKNGCPCTCNSNSSSSTQQH
jgi:hypothetical protein